MKRTSYVMIMLMLASVIFLGCGIGKVDESKVNQDLIGKELYISGDSFIGGTTWKINKDMLKEFKVTKESIDKQNKEENIYGNIKLYYEIPESNGEITSHSVQGEIKIVYKYYDKGGWILEKVERANKNEDFKDETKRTGKYAPLPSFNPTNDELKKYICGTEFKHKNPSGKFQYLQLGTSDIEEVRTTNVQPADEKDRTVTMDIAIKGHTEAGAVFGDDKSEPVDIKGKVTFKYDDTRKEWKRLEFNQSNVE